MLAGSECVPLGRGSKDDNELIGMIELRIEPFRADLGYALARAYWGKGFATEMTKAVVQWAISQESIYRVLGYLRYREYCFCASARKSRYATRRHFKALYCASKYQCSAPRQLYVCPGKVIQPFKRKDGISAIFYVEWSRTVNAAL